MYLKKIFSAILIALICIFMLPNQSVSFAQNEMKNNSYDIKIDYDLKTKTAIASQNVTFTNKTGNILNDICFRLYPNIFSKNNMEYVKTDMRPEEFGYMEINSVRINNKDCKFKVDGINMWLNTNRPISQNETITIHINFKIKLPEPGERYGYCKGTSSFVYWYPMLEVYENNAWQTRKCSSVGELNYCEVADYKVEITISQEEIVASTGVLVKDENLDNGFKLITVEAQNVRDFSWICSSNFSIETEYCDGIKINSYYLKGCKKEATNAGKYAAEAIKYFNGVIGRYPYKEFNVVQWPKESTKGIEHTGIVHIGSLIYKNDKMLKEVVTHEVAHQYFYSIIGNDEYNEPWLDESFATYYTARFLNESLDDPNNYLDTLKSINPDITDKPVLSSLDELDKNTYMYTVYMKGANVLNNFSNIIGQDTFDKIIKTYYEKYKFQTTHTFYLLDIISEIAGKEQASILLKELTDYSYKPQVDVYSEMYGKLEEGQEGFLLLEQSYLCISKPLIKDLFELKKVLPLIPQIKFSYLPYKSTIATKGWAYPLYTNDDLKKNLGKVRDINYDAKSINYDIYYYYTPDSTVTEKINFNTSIDIYPKAYYEKHKYNIFGKIENEENIVYAGYKCLLLTEQILDTTDSKENSSQKYLSVNLNYKGKEFVVVIALHNNIEKNDIYKILKGISIY